MKVYVATICPAYEPQIQLGIFDTLEPAQAYIEQTWGPHAWEAQVDAQGQRSWWNSYSNLDITEVEVQTAPQGEVSP